MDKYDVPPLREVAVERLQKGDKVWGFTDHIEHKGWTVHRNGFGTFERWSSYGNQEALFLDSEGETSVSVLSTVAYALVEVTP